MRKLLLLALIIITTSCSESSTNEKKQPHSFIDELLELNGIDKTKLSEIYKYGINDGLYSLPELSQWPNSIVLTGYKDMLYYWVAVFDKSSKDLLYEFTDYDKPATTTAYGQVLQWEYPTRDDAEYHFTHNLCVYTDCFLFMMAYVSNDRSLVTWDLIRYNNSNQHTRYNITEGDYRYIRASCQKYDNNHIIISKKNDRNYDHSIYDISNCDPLFSFNFEKANTSFDDAIKNGRFVVNENEYSECLIYNVNSTQIQYTNCHAGNAEESQKIAIFESNNDDLTFEPKDTIENIHKEVNDHLYKITRTYYDGTREVKYVHIYIDNTGGHVELE